MSSRDEEDFISEWDAENTERRMNAALIAPKTEAELLAQIDHNDHDTRIVYADWLEENGDPERAEFVRLQDRLYRLPYQHVEHDVLRRCIEIAQRTDMAWRVLVARPQIFNCPSDDCPGDWGSIAPTGLGDVRYCATCDKCVRYCATEGEMQACNRRVEPFVLDIVNTPPGVLPLGILFRGYRDPEDPPTTFDDSVPPWRLED